MLENLWTSRTASRWPPLDALLGQLPFTWTRPSRCLHARPPGLLNWPLSKPFPWQVTGAALNCPNVPVAPCTALLADNPGVGLRNQHWEIRNQFCFNVFCASLDAINKNKWMNSELRMSNFVVGIWSSISRSLPSSSFLYLLIQAPSYDGQHTFFLVIDAVVCYHGLVLALHLLSIVSFLFIIANILVNVLCLAWTILSTSSARVKYWIVDTSDTLQLPLLPLQLQLQPRLQLQLQLPLRLWF